MESFFHSVSSFDSAGVVVIVVTVVLVAVVPPFKVIGLKNGIEKNIRGFRYTPPTDD